MRWIDIRWRKLAFCTAVALMLTAGVFGCNGDDVEDNEEEQQNDEVHEHAAEIHQMCAAAGQTEDGEVTALNCFGPQDPSGKKSESGELEWQPGGFHVVSQ